MLVEKCIGDWMEGEMICMNGGRDPEPAESGHLPRLIVPASVLTCDRLSVYLFLKNHVFYFS